MNPRLLIFETHPIQYRAPVYQALQHIIPDQFEVIFASDCSIRGHSDPGFGEKISWDVPLLDGYPFQVLNNERGQPLASWNSLHGKGVFSLIKSTKPKIIMMCSFGYRFNFAVYFSCFYFRIPLIIRMETQDFAFTRSALLGLVRHVFYRALYLGVSKALYIGTLNRQHYLRHGFRENNLAPALYCTPDRYEKLSHEEKSELRRSTRSNLGIDPNSHVVAFFGKLIPKKDPSLLLQAVHKLSADTKRHIVVLYVGSGELEDSLRNQSSEYEVNTIFTGFVNQSDLPKYYLASDTVVLPSQRMGETWGLVVNEALQAGCCAIVSDSVGCHKDFQHLERMKVIPTGGLHELADAITELSQCTRSFDWAREFIKEYSVGCTARAIANQI